MKVLDCKALLISTLTLGIMATSLWGSNQEPKTDLPAVLVTKEVLIEYVDDRLIQLEETKNPSEEQAEELGYIRENRDDLRKLAEFYGMEIIEERPDKGLSPQESPMREGHREPIKEASQSPVLKADTSQPKREPPVVDGTSFETSEKKEISSKKEPLEETAESSTLKEPERGLSKREAETETVSSDEIPSIHKRSGAVVMASKAVSSPAYPDDPPSSVAITEEEVNQLLAKYTECYALRDIDRFLSLFSSRAMQNWTLGIDQIREIYSEFFDQSQSLLYHIENTTMKFYDNAVETRAHYRIEQILKDEKKNTWSGRVRWILVREDGNVRIRSLDYTQEEPSSQRSKGPTKRSPGALRTDTGR